MYTSCKIKPDQNFQPEEATVHPHTAYTNICILIQSFALPSPTFSWDSALPLMGKGHPFPLEVFVLGVYWPLTKQCNTTYIQSKIELLI